MPATATDNPKGMNLQGVSPELRSSEANNCSLRSLVEQFLGIIPVASNAVL